MNMKDNINLDEIYTEQRNPLTMHIDEESTEGIIRLMNGEDAKVALAVEKEIPNIVNAVDLITEAIRGGGRLIYCGCGTSGRLGILDAVECLPTFSADSTVIDAFMAGGNDALFKAVEHAEDSKELAVIDLKERHFTAKDILCGIAASGRTPYVIGAMEYAKSLGAKVISVTCAKGSEIDRLADIGIAPRLGGEVVTGSTRLKSGTAQKMILNMLSTATMIKLGKVYGNLMVDVKATNNKLVERCIRIVMEATETDRENALNCLEKCGFSAKTAIVMILCSVDATEAEKLLSSNYGRISDILRKD